MHSKGKPFAPDVDFLSLAKRTVGMSGADLANVINEAALLTAREHGTVITNVALEESVDRVVGGPRRKGKVISEKEKKITAYHEGGHALAAWAMPGLEPVYKVTILPRGRTGGHALVVPEDDKSLMTRSEMIARLVMAIGGRAAEELVFAEPTTGASSDIAQATKIARAMVTEYGMSAKLGAVKYGHGDDEPFLGRTMGSGPEYSIEVGSEIDGEVRALIEAAHTEAWAVLNTYRDILDSLAAALLEKETLDRKDLEVIFAEVEKRPRITTFDEFGQPDAVRPAADQDPGRAGDRARRAVAAAGRRARPRAHARSARYPGWRATATPPPGPTAVRRPSPPGGYPVVPDAGRYAASGSPRPAAPCRTGRARAAAPACPQRPGPTAAGPVRPATARRRTGGPATTPAGQTLAAARLATASRHPHRTGPDGSRGRVTRRAPDDRWAPPTPRRPGRLGRRRRAGR